MLQGKELRRIYYNGPIHTLALREPFNSIWSCESPEPPVVAIFRCQEIWETYVPCFGENLGRMEKHSNFKLLSTPRCRVISNLQRNPTICVW